MRRLMVTTFLTLDGVMQAPGGPGEDDSGDFTFGGWSVNYWDERMREFMTQTMSGPFDLLLGRKTYDIFAAFWPTRGDDDPIAVTFNALPKFVMSRSLTDPAWEGTTALSDVAEVAGLKDRFDDIHVIGSGDLARSLLEADLVDRLNLFLYPLTFGSGKRLFADGTGVPAAFRLAQPPQAFSKGAISLAYERAGAPITGIDISQA